MSDTFTEITSQSWGSRILASIKGILFGIILIPVSIVLLFWNESRAVKTARGIKEGAAAVVSIQSATVEPANDRKLVHLSGEATTDEVLRDPMFAVGATAIRLTRSVSMYQWEEQKSSETRKKLGGGTETVTTYNYQKTWSDTRIDSSAFKTREGHENPVAMIAPPLTLTAANVKLGAFKLPPGVLRKMQGEEPLAATQQDLARIELDLRRKVKLDAGAFYIGGDSNTPAPGDQRVTFQILKPAVWSVIARQTGETLEPFPTRVGSPIERVEAGTVSADVMFQHAASENTMVTWLMRLGGFILMAVGLGMLINPFKVIADVIPFLGSIIGAGTTLVSLLLAFVGSILVIAVAWFVVRPVLAISLVVMAVAAIIMGWRYAKGRKTTAVPAV